MTEEKTQPDVNAKPAQAKAEERVQQSQALHLGESTTPVKPPHRPPPLRRPLFRH